MTPGALAGREKVRPPSMTRAVAALSELGLVERSFAPHLPTPDYRDVVRSRRGFAGRRDSYARGVDERAAFRTECRRTRDASRSGRDHHRYGERIRVIAQHHARA